jgi:hemin uptake protein HemP
MRCLIPLIAVVSLVGCTTLRPIEGTSPELQQRITSNELLKPGDHVLIITTDGKGYTFTVTKIHSGVIEGRSVSIPVDQVASVEKREFSEGKTIALVAVTVLVIGGLVAIAAAHTAPAFALK